MSHLPPPLEPNSQSRPPLVGQSEAVGVDSVEWSEQFPKVQEAPAKPGLRSAIAIVWIAVVVGAIALWCGTAQGWMDADTWTWVGLLGGGLVAFVVAILAVKTARYRPRWPHRHPWSARNRPTSPETPPS